MTEDVSYEGRARTLLWHRFMRENVGYDRGHGLRQRVMREDVGCDGGAQALLWHRVMREDMGYDGGHGLRRRTWVTTEGHERGRGL
eukprot:1161240-Pelagomonas_calceolata.AAC.4